MRLLISPLPGVAPTERKVLEFDAIKDLRPIFNLAVGKGGNGRKKRDGLMSLGNTAARPMPK